MNHTEVSGVELPAIYLGDAVYAIYDGYSYWLRLNDHRNTEGEICLEPSVLNNLFNFVGECSQLRVADERKESENLANTNNKQEG